MSYKIKKIVKKIDDRLNLERKAVSRYARISSSKVRRILFYIKGRTYNEALLILKFLPSKASSLICNVLISAVSNFKPINLDNRYYFVKEAKADDASFLKRVQPRAQGRGYPIKKRMCHITSSF